MKNTEPKLITAKQVLKIITWTSLSGLYAGSNGTDALTRFPRPDGKKGVLFSKQECEAFVESIFAAGRKLSDPK